MQFVTIGACQSAFTMITLASTLHNDIRLLRSICLYIISQSGCNALRPLRETRRKELVRKDAGNGNGNGNTRQKSRQLVLAKQSHKPTDDSEHHDCDCESIVPLSSKWRRFIFCALLYNYTIYKIQCTVLDLHGVAPKP